jgi:prolyl-tRNA synthetase
VGDIAKARVGDTCNQCKKGTLEFLRGVELVLIEDQSSLYEKTNYIGSNGKPSNYHIIKIQIDLNKIMASIIESSYDESGMILPAIIAPYEIIIIQISNKQEVSNQVHEVYEILSKEFRIIIDDRKERPGVKFADADLMGFPLKVIISDKTVTTNQLELKFRDGTVISHPLDQIDIIIEMINETINLQYID